MIQTRSFAFAPATLAKNDDGTATVDATLSSGAAVTRKGVSGFYSEVLSTSPQAVNPADHIPILDSHRQGSYRDIVGHVRGIRFEGGNVVATLILSNPDVIAAVSRGDLKGVSIGYRVNNFKDSKDARGGLVRTATSWDLLEASLVAVPSDSLATLRSKPIMTTETTETMTRAETNAAIRSLATRAGLPATWSDEMIDTEVTLDAARAAAAEAMIARSERQNIRTHTPGQIESRATDWNPDDRAIALAHRNAPDVVKLTEGAHEYRHFSMADHARDILEFARIRTRGMSRVEIINRTMELATRGYGDTTTDYPALLVNFARRILEPKYQAAQSPFSSLFNQRNLVDKRPLTHITLGEMPQLLPLSESGEIQKGSPVSTSVGYALGTTARGFSLTRDALINDDLGAFSDVIAKWSAAAAESENQQRIALLLANGGKGPTMSDGTPMFTTGHGNLITTAASITNATMAQAVLQLYEQTSLDGFTPIQVKPAYLMVGPVLINQAQQILHSLNPTTVDQVNPYANNQLTLLIEPRLKGQNTPWYLFTDPKSHVSFEHSYLEGAPGPQIESRASWETLGVDLRCYLDFGCGGIDWRGGIMNTPLSS